MAMDLEALKRDLNAAMGREAEERFYIFQSAALWIALISFSVTAAFRARVSTTRSLLKQLSRACGRR